MRVNDGKEDGDEMRRDGDELRLPWRPEVSVTRGSSFGGHSDLLRTSWTGFNSSIRCCRNWRELDGNVGLKYFQWCMEDLRVADRRILSLSGHTG